MGTIIDVIAFVITLVALLAAVGHAGYLALLSSTARKRPGGEPAARFARRRAPVAGTALGLGLLAVLLSLGGVGTDVFAILLGGGVGMGSMKALRSTQSDFRGGRY
ncbi:hypothetical protein CDG81_19360 [Actinopolyspora erythraea]|uniref:DUF2516 domain-containing protein n=1 Tax=Actinopolyspora erythraea TaxID=414996 RepID=A0A099D7S8_9ACTN|nr:hypothetical protein [Actinopolyspora erythraea]ASU80061.1 hypothetical protein CDG81_19360 [Actinopolyspora erythraea]KGI82208.1 hypothetical protein IL38_05530 [Actinopolyspora erythraea]